jgi:hypothetical protein
MISRSVRIECSMASPEVLNTPSRGSPTPSRPKTTSLTQYGMASKAETSITFFFGDAGVETQPSSPERNVQRGRKSRRMDDSSSPTTTDTKSPSGEATIRGRRRYRSTSIMAIPTSRDASRHFRDPSRSQSPPSRKFVLWVFIVERRRSPSPSRSRSPNTRRARQRRRQRTRSRGRIHPVDSISNLTLEFKSGVQSEVVVFDKMDCEADDIGRQRESRAIGV